MQQDWQAFLTEQNAVIDNSTVKQFSAKQDEIDASNSGTILADLSHYTLIRVTGDDTIGFLQGQLSNDIKHVSENHSQMSVYCSPKGRALALIRIFKTRDDYFLSLPSEIADETIGRLKMFVMRSDVKMEDVTDEYFHFGLCGESASTALVNALDASSTPSNTDDSIVTNDISVQKLAGEVDRFELFGLITNAQPLWDKLKQESQPVGESAWNFQRINAGIPEILTATSEGFVPQMLNLQLINAVNFQKGCYPGQEIVARTKYLGKLKKRLYLVDIDTADSVELNSDIYENGDNQQSVGKVILIEATDSTTSRALAVLRIAALDNQPLTIFDKSGPSISVLDMPYELEEETP